MNTSILFFNIHPPSFYCFYKFLGKIVSQLEFKKRDNYTRCMSSAVYSLAMREHSRSEIRNKLKRKEYSGDVDLDALLDILEEKDYLNEERFTESFIRYRIARGQGAVKIVNDLKIRGVSSYLINRSIQEADVDWLVVATEQREKKFGEGQPIDIKGKARQVRFLAGRGFPFGIIYSVVD